MTSSTIQVLENIFMTEANFVFGHARGSNVQCPLRKFKALFGISPTVCATGWNSIQSSLPEKCLPKYLLWACMVLKIYSSEHIHCTLVNTSEKTFRKWSWTIIVKLSANCNVRFQSSLGTMFINSNRKLTNIHYYTGSLESPINNTNKI